MAQQALEKGGFSDTVGTDDGNLLVALKSEIGVVCGSETAVIANFQITSLEDKAAGVRAILKIKGRLWFFSLKLTISILSTSSDGTWPYSEWRHGPCCG